MTTATRQNTGRHSMAPQAGAQALYASPLAASGLLARPAILFSLDGRPITACLADVSSDGTRWDATLRALEKPGAVAALYFHEGVRDAVLQLDGGRRVRVRITGTAFRKREQRVCYVTGRTPSPPDQPLFD